MRKDKNSKLPIWNSQDARAKFSEMVHQAESQNQLITNRNRTIAVVIAKRRYDQVDEILSNKSLLFCIAIFSLVQ